MGRASGGPPGGQPDHYAVLGVGRRAPVEEIRAAYLALARRWHPDFHRDRPSAELAARRMQEINAAWTVLGNPRRRVEYDRQLGGSGPAGVGAEPGRAAGTGPPASERDPFGPDRRRDADEPVAAWLTEDPPGPPASPGRRLATVAPVVALAVGTLLLLAALVLRAELLVAVGVVAMVLSAVGFFVAPLAVMADARRGDRQ